MSADERPGGWVEGIGWVARLRDLGPYDIAANPDGRIAQARIHRSAGVTPQWGYVTVVGWADGTEPERPVLAAYDSTAGDPFAAVRTLPEWDELETATMTNGVTRGGHERSIVAAAVAFVNAIPVAAGGATPDPAQRHERISGASVYCSCGNGWPCLEGTTPR